MAAWYEPIGGASRATCVAQIISDIEAYLETDATGKRSFNIAQFMILAGTRLAAIPDPTNPVVYSAPEVLRGTDVRPFVETMKAEITALASSNAGAGDGAGVAQRLADLRAKSAAVTAAFDRLVTDESSNTPEIRAILADIEEGLPAVEEREKQTVFYRTTFVNDWENESAPSPVSEAVEIGQNDTVTINRPTVPSGRDIAYWRIYRSNSGSETSAYQYVPNAANDLGVPVATTTFADDVPNSELQEVCPTTIWAHPPSDLGCIVDMANGIHIGFHGNTLRPTPPFVPFAFPDEYAQTVESPIVGLVGWEQSAFVGTRGKPYFVSGTDGANLTLRKLDSNQACVSARGIVSTERGVIFPSPDGLCLATPAGVRVLTEAHFTREEWQALSPEDLIVREHDGVVYFVARETVDAPATSDYLWVFTQNSGASLTNSNQRLEINIATAGSGSSRGAHTNAITAGAKVYCEFQVMQWPAGNPFVGFGVTRLTNTPVFYAAGVAGMYSGNGGCGFTKTAGPILNGADQTGAAGTYAFTSADRIGIAVDMATGKMWFAKNGTWLAGDPAAGTGAPVTFTPGADTWRWHASTYACIVSTGTYHIDIFPNPGSQSYAPPTGFTSFQPF